MAKRRSVPRRDAVQVSLPWLTRPVVDWLANLRERRPLRTDSRGGVGQYALVGLVVVVVGAALLVTLGGGVLDGDPGDSEMTDSEPAADTEPTPVEDGDDNATDDADEDSADDSDPADSDGGNSNESDPGDEPDYAAIAGSVNVTDLGTTDDGVVRLTEYLAEETLARHDLANGSEFRFEKLAPDKTYTVNVITQQAPPEEFVISTNASETVTKTFEVGHPMKATESFVLDWVVETESREDYRNGKAIVDSEGNSYNAWDWDETAKRYKQLYFARNGNSYTTYGEGLWQRTYDNYENLATSTRLILNGLSDIEKREFVGETSRVDSSGTVYEYRVPDTVSGLDMSASAAFISVDPKTGYVTSYRMDTPIILKDGTVTTDRGHVLKRNDEQISAIPKDFPVDDLPGY